jgi:hypothetical protein
MGSEMSALPSKADSSSNPSSANSRHSAGSEDKRPRGAKSGRNLSGSNNGDETHFSKNRRETSNQKEQGFGVMRRVPHCALVHSYVLNNLEKGPARVADLVRRGQAEFGFSHAEIESAAKHFAVVTQVKRGQIYWRRPTNLFAIWWGLDRAPDL